MDPRVESFLDALEDLVKAYVLARVSAEDPPDVVEKAIREARFKTRRRLESLLETRMGR